MTARPPARRQSSAPIASAILRATRTNRSGRLTPIASRSPPSPPAGLPDRESESSLAELRAELEPPSPAVVRRGLEVCGRVAGEMKQVGARGRRRPRAALRQLVIRPGATSAPPAGHDLPAPDEPVGSQRAECRVDRGLREALPPCGS